MTGSRNANPRLAWHDVEKNTASHQQRYLVGSSPEPTYREELPKAVRQGPWRFVLRSLMWDYDVLQSQDLRCKPERHPPFLRVLPLICHVLCAHDAPIIQNQLKTFKKHKRPPAYPGKVHMTTFLAAASCFTSTHARQRTASNHQLPECGPVTGYPPVPMLSATVRSAPNHSDLPPTDR